jgi:hypothetical protein
MLYFALIIILLAVALWGLLRKQKRQANITGWVETADLNGKGRQVYRDEQAGISCKPDVVERSKVIEYKSAAANGKARWVDLLQLALQIQATGKSEGELRYSNKSFYFKKDDPAMKTATRNALKISNRMRWHLLAGSPPKATPSLNRCAKCVFLKECPEAVH